MYKSANVSDYGGIDDINDINGSCGCSTQCSANPCSKCQQDCALSCAAQNNLLNAPLPVEWLDFRARLSGEKVRLEWATASEAQNRGFEIERSPDGHAFESVGWVAGRGTTPFPSFYEYEDPLPGAGRFYYRLKQVDYNGSFAYGSMLQIYAPEPGPDFVFDAEKQRLYLQQQNGPERIFVRIQSILGQQIYVRTLEGISAPWSLDLSALPAGTYLLRAGWEGRSTQQVKVIQIH